LIATKNRPSVSKRKVSLINQHISAKFFLPPNRIPGMVKCFCIQRSSREKISISSEIAHIDPYIILFEEKEEKFVKGKMKKD